MSSTSSQRACCACYKPKRAPATARRTARLGRGCLLRRSAIDYVKFVTGAEDDRAIGYLSGACFRDLWLRISLVHTLVDFELFHIDVYAFIASKLPNRARRTPIVGQALHVHVVVVPRIETLSQRQGRRAGHYAEHGRDPDGQQSTF